MSNLVLINHQCLYHLIVWCGIIMWNLCHLFKDIIHQSKTHLVDASEKSCVCKLTYRTLQISRYINNHVSTYHAPLFPNIFENTYHFSSFQTRLSALDWGWSGGLHVYRRMYSRFLTIDVVIMSLIFKSILLDLKKGHLII